MWRSSPRWGPGAWRATVRQYLYQGYDASPVRTETEVVFVPDSDAARIASFGGGAARSPLWLVDQLSVVRDRESVLAVAGTSTGRYPGLVAGALKQVRRTVPAWRGPLVVEVPRTTRQLEAAVLAETGQYDNIAAVTTTADGSLAPDAPVRVFVNPVVFDKLKPRGAQVVMSHETAHRSHGRDVHLDAHVAAGGLRRLRRPRRCRRPGPGGGWSDPRPDPQGRTAPKAAHERRPRPEGQRARSHLQEAWLACRFIAQEYGADRLVRFYRKVGAGASAEGSFRSELGTTQARFLVQWRADLARLAGVAR